MKLETIINTGATFLSLTRYNLKIIFANKFIYFLFGATVWFLFVTVINVIDEGGNLDEEDMYGILMLPGLLLIFYPTAFGIQNDVDSRMLETLFGIPNYRYKVWLVRMVLVYLIVTGMVFILSLLSLLAITDISVTNMVFHLMFPISFLGSMAFMFSTIVRNGNGTAVVVIIIGFFFFILGENLEDANRLTKWNIFLNPYDVPNDVNEVIWADVKLSNRIFLSVGIILAVLLGLLNLQKREKFMQ